MASLQRFETAALNRPVKPGDMRVASDGTLASRTRAASLSVRLLQALGGGRGRSVQDLAQATTSGRVRRAIDVLRARGVQVVRVDRGEFKMEV